ncbi:MAG: hypothetical protein PHI63_05560, partial [Patescibacteria group bacterium]|nr:hypothetical protein [Patescibacteria group bacterium]
PSSSPACCEILCPNNEKTCEQTTKDLCTQDYCDSGGFNNVCDVSNYGSGCQKVSWKEDCDCVKSDDPDVPPQCIVPPKTGCCQIPATDGPEYGYWCVPDITKEECEKIGPNGELPGIWDEFCNTCDLITSTCREPLCCKLSSSQCVQVKFPRECEAAGGTPLRGQCNKTTGECEKTGCCEFDDPDNTQDHQTTRDECGQRPWYEGSEWNRESHSCKEEVGCCRASDIAACTDSTQSKCEGAGATWLKGAACNYHTGLCTPKDLKMTVSITPDSNAPGNKNVRPTTDQTLLCSGRVENYKGWRVAVDITGLHGQPFSPPNVCISGADPCTFTVSIPSAATIAGDKVICSVGIYDDDDVLYASTRDDTTVQTCVYMGFLPVPKETATQQYIDIIFFPSNVSDQENWSWRNKASSFKYAIAEASPFNEYKNNIRFWRGDWSGLDGLGWNSVYSEVGESKDQTGKRPIFNGENDGCDIVDNKDPIIIVEKNDQDMKNAWAFIGIDTAIVGWSRALPGAKAETVAKHELGHLFGLVDENLDATDISIPMYGSRSNCYPVPTIFNPSTAVPCGVDAFGWSIFNGGSGWCRKPNPDPVPETSECHGVSTVASILADSPCTNKMGCRGVATPLDSLCMGQKEETCKLSNLCKWAPICYIYAPNICMDKYAYYDIGVDCMNGTGCYPGCGAFRSSPHSIMSQTSSSEYNELHKAIIRSGIECRVDVTTSCPVPSTDVFVDSFVLM